MREGIRLHDIGIRFGCVNFRGKTVHGLRWVDTVSYDPSLITKLPIMNGNFTATYPQIVSGRDVAIEPLKLGIVDRFGQTCQITADARLMVEGIITFNRIAKDVGLSFRINPLGKLVGQRIEREDFKPASDSKEYFVLKSYGCSFLSEIPLGKILRNASEAEWYLHLETKVQWEKEEWQGEKGTGYMFPFDVPFPSFHLKEFVDSIRGVFSQTILD